MEKSEQTDPQWAKVGHDGVPLIHNVPSQPKHAELGKP